MTPRDLLLFRLIVHNLNAIKAKLITEGAQMPAHMLASMVNDIERCLALEERVINLNLLADEHNPES